MPTISSPSRPPLRRVLPVPQPAEELVDVPMPEWMRLALRLRWCRQGVDLRMEEATPRGSTWCLEGTQHTQWARPEGFTASPGR